jgi:hemolysin III
MFAKISKDEFFNSITHGLGTILAIAGFTLLMASSTATNLVSVLVYGMALIALYSISTAYHIVMHVRVKNVFRRLDHIAIFLLIAGTYTPYCMRMAGKSGLIILSLVWFLSAFGIVLKIFFTGRFEFVSVVLYLCLGWLVVFVIKDIYQLLSVTSFLLLVIGGLLYSSGIFFYRRSVKYNHGIWHLFVLGGSIAHFISIFLLVSI